MDQATISRWLTTDAKSANAENALKSSKSAGAEKSGLNAPKSRQHFDILEFGKPDAVHRDQRGDSAPPRSPQPAPATIRGRPALLTSPRLAGPPWGKTGGDQPVVGAERRMGELLAETERARPPNPKPPKHRQSLGVTDDRPPTLAEIGVTKRESAEAQRFPALPSARPARHTRRALADRPARSIVRGLAPEALANRCALPACHQAPFQ